ncbi:class I SAM-dependent RNA methyltransferase [Pseudactinotalea suaedae]|uniref:class I SAM-dependent RNA methyltransferase n=1 Tax=Pseudactinotalea suaedae TaxID=1524924 RepID=UPI0012E0D2A8|nr:TRAM domain-containing protein [Pseudactinotalea suaedae]
MADDTGEDLVLDVGPAVHGGHCLARHEGRVVFVRHALPGEKVRVRLTEQRREGYWRGDAVEILDASPDRVPSIWPEAGPGGVGGGELAHVAIEAQRRWKRDVLTDALVRIGKLEPQHPLLEELTVEPVPGDLDGLGTRTRIELTADAEGRAGMYRHRTHEVLALREMPLAVPEINAFDLLSRSWPAGARIDAVAPTEGEPAVLVNGQPWRGGRSHVREQVTVGDVTYRYRLAAAGFWQIHRGAPAMLVSAVLEAAALQPGDSVIDAYSGAGLLSVPLAHTVGPEGLVLAVESDDQATRDARRNAHGLDQLELRTGQVARTLADIDRRPDVVVLDPPRAGAGADVLDRLADLGVSRVVYVACDPAALARDVRIALDHGYRLESLRGFDLFPHTHHVEALATLVW